MPEKASYGGADRSAVLRQVQAGARVDEVCAQGRGIEPGDVLCCGNGSIPGWDVKRVA